MAVDGLLSLRWNNHSSSFLKQLSLLHDKETYSDLTLVCGGQFYQVHRLVVSGCSEYFRAILEHTPCRHPAVVLQDVPPRYLEALLSYMYLGQVSVPQDDLRGLIKAAECLAIKGLAVPDESTATPLPDTRHPATPLPDTRHPATSPLLLDTRHPATSPLLLDTHRHPATSPATPTSLPDTHRHPATPPSLSDTHKHLATEKGQPNPKRRRHDREATDPATDPANDPASHPASHRARIDKDQAVSEHHKQGRNRGRGTENSPLPHTTTFPSQQHTEEEETIPVFRVKEERQDEVKCEDDLMLDLPEMCGGLGHEEGRQEEGHTTTTTTAFSPGLSSYAGGGGGGGGGPQYPAQPHTPAMDGDTSQGWETNLTKGEMLQGFQLDTFSPPPPPPPHQDTLTTTTTTTTHHTAQRGRGRSGWSRPGEAATYPDHRSCQICGYRGQDLSQLRKHLRIHTGEKPYQCSSCSYSSTQSSNLKAHIKRHHLAFSQSEDRHTDGQQHGFFFMQ